MSQTQVSQTKEEVSTLITFPEGRVINAHLFEKDKYDEKATPQYKIEMAYDPEDLIAVEDEIVDYAVKTWGHSAEDEYNSGHIVTPIIEGDDLALRREKKGKAGDAYKGKLVIRANTQFNKDGANAPGGIKVYGPAVEDIDPVNAAQIYSGCYGVLLGEIKHYETNKGERALKIYLKAFQKTKDGERLSSAGDYSKAFAPVAGAAAATAAGGARRRRG